MKKNTGQEVTAVKSEPLKFSKEQIVASKKYSPFKDFLNGNLVDGQMYSLDEVDALLIENKLMKGKGE